MYYTVCFAVAAILVVHVTDCKPQLNSDVESIVDAVDSEPINDVPMTNIDGTDILDDENSELEEGSTNPSISCIENEDDEIVCINEPENIILEDNNDNLPADTIIAVIETEFGSTNTDATDLDESENSCDNSDLDNQTLCDLLEQGLSKVNLISSDSDTLDNENGDDSTKQTRSIESVVIELPVVLEPVDTLYFSGVVPAYGRASFGYQFGSPLFPNSVAPVPLQYGCPFTLPFYNPHLTSQIMNPIQEILQPIYPTVSYNLPMYTGFEFDNSRADAFMPEPCRIVPARGKVSFTAHFGP